MQGNDNPEVGGIADFAQAFGGKKRFLVDYINDRGVLTGNVTLTVTDSLYQSADAGAGDRNIALPPSATTLGIKALNFFVFNYGASHNLAVKDGNTTKGTVSPGQVGFFSYTGSAWKGFVFLGTATTGFMQADGSVTGATAQSQIFTDGVTLDAIVGNTTDMTITGLVGSSSAGSKITLTGGAGNGSGNAGGLVEVKGGGGAANGAGGAAKLTGNTAASGNGAGGNTTVLSGAGTGSGAGGDSTATAGAGGATGAGGSVTGTAGRGGSTSGAAGLATYVAGAGGAGTTTAGGVASLTGGGSGTGATGNGGIGKVVGGAALSTAGTGGKGQCIGGLGTTTGAGGAAELTGGVGGSSGAGGAATVTGGASAGAGGTAGAVTVDAGAATGGAPAAVNIGTTNASAVNIALASVATVIGGPITESIGASTAAGGTGVVGDATALPSGTASVYPTTAADGTKAVKLTTADKITGRRVFIGNGVSNQILKVFAPSGGNINGLGADTAFSTASGKGCTIICLSGAGNTWLGF